MYPAMHELVCAGFGERALGHLRRTVGSILGGAPACFGSEHEDDRAAPALGHPPNYRLGREERPVAVDLELKIKILFGYFGEGLTQIGARIVDQHTDRTEF